MIPEFLNLIKFGQICIIQIEDYSWAVEHLWGCSMAMDIGEREQVVNLISQARELLNQFSRMEPFDRERASELVAELQALLEEFRRICPPGTFRRRQH